LEVRTEGGQNDLSGMLASFGEGFFGIAGECEYVVGRLKPAVYPGIGIVQKFVELCFFLVDL